MLTINHRKLDPKLWSMQPTLLGKATVESSLPINESKRLYSWFSTKKFSCMSILPILACVVPIYARTRLKKMTGWQNDTNVNPVTGETKTTHWKIMHDQYRRNKLSVVDKRALCGLGFEAARIERCLLQDGKLLDPKKVETHERILNVLILYDVAVNFPNQPEIISKKWHLSLTKLKDIQIESAQMCGRVKKFLKTLNYTSGAGHFGQTTRNMLQPTSDMKRLELAALGIAHRDADRLHINNLSTPNEIVRADLSTIISCLTDDGHNNQDTNDKTIGERALAIQNAARRHLHRLKYQDAEEEEKEEEEENDEERKESPHCFHPNK